MSIGFSVIIVGLGLILLVAVIAGVVIVGMQINDRNKRNGE